MADLGSLARLQAGETRSISAENPDGAPGGGGRASEGTGAHAARELGRGWKVSPSIDVPAGAATDLAVITGPGEIRHVWLTTHPSNWRRLVLRMHWDGADEPAVEVPVGDFFGQGWGAYAALASVPVAVNPHGGFNCYWPMPFRSGARISLENLGPEAARVYYQVTFQTGARDAAAGYLHAQWRRSNPVVAGGPHGLVEGVEGRGQYVGTYLAWGVNSSGWWGEGEVKFYLDDDADPTICGTGTEDYFGGAWNFDVPGEGYARFSTPYLGLHQILQPDGLYASQQRFGMYRWHIPDPVSFATRLRVDVQDLGWRDGGRYHPRHDDLASTAFLYVDRPVTRRPPAPTADAMEIL